LAFRCIYISVLTCVTLKNVYIYNTLNAHCGDCVIRYTASTNLCLMYQPLRL